MIYNYLSNIYIQLLGIVLLILGIIKIITCSVNIILTNDNIQYFNDKPIIKYLLIHDYSIAGKMFSIIILLFGIFTILKAFFLLKILKNKKLIDFISNEYNTTLIYLIFGTYLILFYGFITYFPFITDIFITKNRNFKNIYEVIGMGTGLLFIIIYLFRIIYFNYNNINILILSIIGLIITSSFYSYLLANNGTDFKNEFLTQIIIPLTSI